MAGKLGFAEEEMAVDLVLGYPKAYANLCRNLHLHGPFTRGPPFTFYPYALQTQDDLRAREFDQLFPCVETEKEASTKAKYYVNILWKQLNHLGNAGFDPAKFRVDPYGNVLYFHADSGSPLAWEIDHWFPRSRGGTTVPSNLKMLQWQVFEKKFDKLEFLVPWWDLQLGISVNQFLSIFASSNSDFRNRAFSWLFLGGKNEELNDLQDVESHCFPQHFVETQDKTGPAPAAIVFSRRNMDASALKPIDFNRYPRSNSPTIGLRKFSIEEDESLSKAIQQFSGLSPSISNNNENCYSGSSQYLAIAAARDSLRQRQLAVKKHSEIKNLDDELNELKETNEVERLGLQELELTLIKRRRRAEKCRRLAEAQSTYKASLEKMIRDAMHQNVVYKEQIRLTQTANSALTARLEAQKAICESAKSDLRRRLQQREDLENQIKPYSEQTRKRSRMDDNQFTESSNETLHLLPEKTMQKPLQKELRLFLEEDHSRAEAGASLVILKEKGQGRGKEQVNNTEERHRLEEVRLDEELQKLVIGDGKHKRANEVYKSKSVPQSPRIEDDEEYRKKIGKGYVEKWLQMLLESAQEESTSATSSPKPNQYEINKTDEMIQKLNHKKPQKEIKILTLKTPEHKVETMKDSSEGGKKLEMEKKDGAQKVAARRKSFEVESKEEKNGKGKGLVRSESARAFRPIPSSPSVILEMRKRVDCIGRKPLVIDDEDNEDNINQSTMATKSVKTSIKACTKAIKSAVKK